MSSEQSAVSREIDTVFGDLRRILEGIINRPEERLMNSLKILTACFLETKEAVNYLSWGVTVKNNNSEEEEKLEIRVQRLSGKDPVQVAAEFAAQNRQLREVLDKLRMASRSHSKGLDDEVCLALQLPLPAPASSSSADKAEEELK